VKIAAHNRQHIGLHSLYNAVKSCEVKFPSYYVCLRMERSKGYN